MHSTVKAARVAGAFYLALVLAAPLRLIYIPSTLFVTGNATATVTNIAAHETIFRLGITADLFCGVILIFLTLNQTTQLSDSVAFARFAAPAPSMSSEALLQALSA
jgi:hypothetical protein